MLIKFSDVHMAQRGIGMVEVLVSMLVLAIGVLGFSVLQVRAVETTTEASNRSTAMLILRGLADDIRTNNGAVQNYNAYVDSYNSTVPAPTTLKTKLAYSDYPTAVSAYKAITSTPTTSAPKCISTDICTSAQSALNDAYVEAQLAFNQGMLINMTQCPGVAAAPVKRQCLFAAWGKTTPTLGTGTNDCMDNTGTYSTASTCLMMEAY